MADLIIIGRRAHDRLVPRNLLDFEGVLDVLIQLGQTVPPLPFPSNLSSITAPRLASARSNGLSGAPAGASRVGLNS